MCGRLTGVVSTLRWGRLGCVCCQCLPCCFGGGHWWLLESCVLGAFEPCRACPHPAPHQRFACPGLGCNALLGGNRVGESRWSTAAVLGLVAKSVGGVFSPTRLLRATVVNAAPSLALLASPAHAACFIASSAVSDGCSHLAIPTLLFWLQALGTVRVPLWRTTTSRSDTTSGRRRRSSWWTPPRRKSVRMGRGGGVASRACVCGVW